jgi:sirohydrochlorin cobaltochelatase
VNGDDLSDAALVVLGHGTVLNEQSAAPVRQHAAELRRRGIFREVREAFWKQEPQIRIVLAGITAPRVFIAPLFLSDGYFAGQVIPAALGFNYPERLSLTTPASTLLYCRPVGSHPGMTKVILARAAGVVKQFPFPRAPKNAETTLFIAGHGTERNKNSRSVAEEHAELIRTQNLYAVVHAIFMEETPRIGDGYGLARTKNLVIVPFFISDGLHVAEDIPILLGEPERVVKERLAGGRPTWRNPTERNGHLVWYADSVGTEPLLADVILERVREAVKEAAGQVAGEAVKPGMAG